MSVTPDVPAAPLLRAIRAGWLKRAIKDLMADSTINAAGLVGSLGRGEADDWSDVDLLIVVPDDRVDVDATNLPGSELVAWSIDARHNAPCGAGAVGVRYVIDGLPLHVDWHVYPRLMAAWVVDATIIFDEVGFPRLSDTFSEYQFKREVQAPTPKPDDAHQILQVSLIPVAAKYVVRRSPEAGRMVEFVGGPYAPDATPGEYLLMLRELLERNRGQAPETVVASAGRYLALAAETLYHGLND